MESSIILVLAPQTSKSINVQCATVGVDIAPSKKIPNNNDGIHIHDEIGVVKNKIRTNLEAYSREYSREFGKCTLGETGSKCRLTGQAPLVQDTLLDFPA